LPVVFVFRRVRFGFWGDSAVIQTLVTSVTVAVVVSFCCSLCEAVLYSISASQVEMLKKSGHAAAENLQHLRADIDEPITAILTLNTIANTIGASVAGATAAKIFGDEHLLLFSSIFTLTILIFSEILPKTIGVNYAFKLAPYVAFPLQTMVMLLKPIIWLCRTITWLLPKRTEESITAEELQTIAALSRESGDLEENEEKVINNIIDLKNKIVRQVMTPRTVTFSLNEHMTVGNAVAKLNELSSHSRIPIYNREPNNVTGIIMRKDILQAAAEGKNKLTLARFKHPAHFVPETARLNRILVDFFDRRQHLFIVVDEYGTMTGIISMEDVLEEIVGMEIIDESDKAKDMRELARARNIESRKSMKKNEQR
jgi:CBS domain containing-hemolysin-like protein